MTFNVKIKQHTPQVSDRDRQRGYIIRYFAAKANQINDRVYEIDHREYRRLQSNPYVITAKTTWAIRGRLEDFERTVTLNDQDVPITIPGVLTQNESATIFVSKKIPALEKFLRDPQELYLDEASMG